MPNWKMRANGLVLGILLHDADQAQDGLGAHEAVGVEHHHMVEFAAPLLAELADVAGLVAGVDHAPAIGDRETAVENPREFRREDFLRGTDLRLEAVAQDEAVQLVGRAAGGQTAQHGDEIASQPRRILVAHADQDGGARGDRIVAEAESRDGRCDDLRLPAEQHEGETDQRVPKADDRPGQRDGEGRQHEPVDDVEPARRQGVSHQRKHGEKGRGGGQGKAGAAPPNGCGCGDHRCGEIFQDWVRRSWLVIGSTGLRFA
jgi:hypothetical protein